MVAHLIVDDVWARYGKKGPYVLRGFSLEVGKGEILALLGPSGCGKSTALKVIAGFVMPERGRVLIGGRDVTSLPPHKRGVGIVFQSYALFPHMTVFQNVAYGLIVRRAPRALIEERVRGALRLLGLSGLENRYPRELSGGQQQRVALARALVVEPEVLLLDEPMSNVDPVFRSKLRGELRALIKRLDLTAIYVTHDRDDAFEIADRIAIMREGVIEQCGTTAELLERPKSRFVAEFVGVENIIEVDLRSASPLGESLLVRGGPGALLLVPGRGVPGGRAFLCLRPEDLSLSREPPSGPPRIEGTVVQRSPRGPSTKYIVNTPLGLVSVTRPEASGDSFEVGERVFLSYNVANAVLVVE